jgi:serine/threonine-protein kinase
MGAVYLVRDNRIPGKRWAMKEMSDAAIADLLERQQAIDAFRQEAQLLATLDHVNLPRVTDFLSEAGCHYLVMDFVEGETLENLLSRQTTPFSEAQVLDWAGQLCDVLSYLHARQPPVIFRDLKPGNIMLTPDGHLKLIDFGIARFFKPGQATDTIRFGTPGYAPPEQYGKGQTDHRSDVYALGVTMHQLLTLHDPAATPFVLPPVRKVNSRVTPRTEAAIQQATQLETAQRFQAAADMKRALGLA